MPSVGQKVDGLGEELRDATEVVTAIVQEVRQGAFPEVELKLASAAEGEWHGAPRYKSSGRRDVRFFSDVENVRDFAAYYLVPGDVISVNRAGARRGTTHVVWEIDNIKRLPSGTPLEPPKDGEKLRGSAGTDQGSYAKGDRVRIAFTVRNVSRETLDLRFSSGQQYEIVVYRNEVPVWHWSKGLAFTMALWTKKIESGEEMVFSEDWDQTLDGGGQAQPGLYKATAYLTTMEGYQAVASAVFEIE